MKPAPPKTEVFHYMEYFSRFFCTPKRWLKIGKKSNVIVISIQRIIPHWFSPQLFCLRNQVAQFTKPCWNTVLTLNSPEESLSARCSNNSLQYHKSYGKIHTLDNSSFQVPRVLNSSIGRLIVGWFSKRTGASVDDGARKSNNWLDQWQSGKLSTGSRV